MLRVDRTLGTLGLMPHRTREPVVRLLHRREAEHVLCGVLRSHSARPYCVVLGRRCVASVASTTLEALSGQGVACTSLGADKAQGYTTQQRNKSQLSVVTAVLYVVPYTHLTCRAVQRVCARLAW